MLFLASHRLSLSRGHQTVTTMNHCCCFDGLWKFEVKYIVLCLNAFAKLQHVRGAFSFPFLAGNAQLVVTFLGPINTQNQSVPGGVLGMRACGLKKGAP